MSAAAPARHRAVFCLAPIRRAPRRRPRAGLPGLLAGLVGLVGLAGLAGLPSGPAAAQPAAAGTDCVVVEVQQVRPRQGHLMVAAYVDAASFGKAPVAQLRLPAGEQPVMTFKLCGVRGEQVALMLFQDLDSDGKMGRNPLGMPLEPWGSSGSPGIFGPAWDTGRVPLDGKTVVVRMSS